MRQVIRSATEIDRSIDRRRSVGVARVSRADLPREGGGLGDDGGWEEEGPGPATRDDGESPSARRARASPPQLPDSAYVVLRAYSLGDGAALARLQDFVVARGASRSNSYLSHLEVGSRRWDRRWGRRRLCALMSGVASVSCGVRKRIGEIIGGIIGETGGALGSCLHRCSLCGVVEVDGESNGAGSGPLAEGARC